MQEEVRSVKERPGETIAEKISEFTDAPQAVQDMLEETWHQELQDTEQRRNDLLPGASKDAVEVAKVAESTGRKEAVPEERGQMS